MLKKAFGTMLLAAAVLTVLGIGADFSDYKALRSIHVAVVADDQEFIDLTPIQPYAYISEAGILVIDFSDNNPNYPGDGGTGISPASEYNFDSVFGVSNHIWSNDSEYGYIIVNITSSNPSVELYCKEDPTNIGDNLCYAYNLFGNVAYNSDSAAQTIEFCIAPGATKEIGMDLTGPTSISTQWMNGTLTIKAVPDTGGVCYGP
jgi:hypothetical protein